MNLNLQKILSIAVALAACGLSMWTLVYAQQFLMPLPKTISVLNLVVALMGMVFSVFTTPVLSKLQQLKISRPAAQISPILYLVPYTLGIIAIMYVTPANVRGCRAELEWDSFFRSKNEDAIRSLQNQMHCCGLNSMRDRAWPFPSHDIDARTCERTSGFTAHCGPLWDQRIVRVIVGVAMASVLNVLMMVRHISSIRKMTADKEKWLLMNSITTKLPGSSNSTTFDRNTNATARLPSDDVEQTFAEERRRLLLSETE